MTDFQIIDEKTSNVAGVSAEGEQYVAPRYYSDPYYKSVAVLNTAYEIVPAKSGKRFVVTGLLLAADKNFATSVDSETLTLYEASPADITTNLKTFTQVDLLRNDRLIATGLSLRASIAVSLVAIATSALVDVTIAGYYVDA